MTGKGDPATALAGIYFWTWNTEEVLAMILSGCGPGTPIRRHPQEGPLHRLRHADHAGRAARIALEALADVDPKKSVSQRERLVSVTSAFDAGNLGRLPEAERALLLQAARELEMDLKSHETALFARHGRERASRVLRCARVLVQCLEMHSKEPAASALRDSAMAENALWALEQEGPDGKIVLWAHNGHVAAQEGAMGARLRNVLGEDLRVFGFAFGEGAFQAVPWPPPKFGLTTFNVPLLAEGSLDATLAATGIEVGSVDLRTLPKQGPVAEHAGRRPGRTLDPEPSTLRVCGPVPGHPAGGRTLR